MVALWPTDLPQELGLNSFQETERDAIVKDGYNVGPPQHRRRTTSSPRMVNGSMLMTEAQVVSLFDFFSVDTLDGVLSFHFPTQGYTISAYWRARFATPPSFTPEGNGYWMVNLELEVLGDKAPISISYIGYLESTADLTTYTFASAAIGTPATDRLVVVTVHKDAGSSTAISSGTIGGVTATIVQGTGAQVTGIMYAIVPSGATGNIVITFNAASLRCQIGVFTIYNYNSVVPIDTGTVNAVTATTHTVTLDLPAQSVGVAAVTPSLAGITSVWSQGTERYDQSAEASQSASATELVGGAGLGIAVTSTHSNDSASAAGAVWQ